MSNSDKQQKTLAHDVLAHIEEEHIAPKPRWHFLIKDYVVWATGIASLVVGSVAVSVIIFAAVNSDFAYRHLLSRGPFEHIVQLLPVLWIVLLAVFVALAYYNFKHTKHGYRHRLIAVVSTSILISIAAGTGLYAAGASQIADYAVSRALPFHPAFDEKRQALWVQPERGLLAGYVVSIEDSGDLAFEDFEGKNWNISTEDLNEREKGLFAHIDTVSIIGEQISDDEFRACLVRPWMIKGESPQLKNHLRARFTERGKRPPIVPGAPSRVLTDYAKSSELGERKFDALRIKECERDIPRPGSNSITD